MNGGAGLNEQQSRKTESWRREVIGQDHVLSSERIAEILAELEQWVIVDELNRQGNFFEPLALCDRNGARTGVHAPRGLCHLLWLRHEVVDGLLFTRSGMVVIQMRSMSVVDSPGLYDMSFAGHVGTAKVSTTDPSESPQALEREAMEEASIDLTLGSKHILHSADREPLCSYTHLDPPRPDERFYNAEVRYVYAIRLTDDGTAALAPGDGEVSGFLLCSIDEAWRLFRTKQISSSLRYSGAKALYHALRNW